MLETDTSEVNDPCVPTERSSPDASPDGTDTTGGSCCCLRERRAVDDGLLGKPSGLDGVDGPLLVFLVGRPDIVLCFQRFR